MVFPNVEYLFLAFEDKDVYCLKPIMREVLRQGLKSDILSFNLRNSQALYRLARSEFPVVICSSLSALNVAKIVRGNLPALYFGVEHGISPFKKYTYSSHFLKYDRYFSPTELWNNRLLELYPEGGGKFVLGGFPRIEDIKNTQDESNGDNFSLEEWGWGYGTHNKRLVIFSWGIDPEVVGKLPDEHGIVYLFHPASRSQVNRLSFSKSKVAVSTPEISSNLVFYADTVYGDFSSFSLEAMALGKKVRVFICRELYLNDCGMETGDGFFDKFSDSFFKIPHYENDLIKDNVISSLPELTGELCCEIYDEVGSFNVFPEVAFPPVVDGAAKFMVDKIISQSRCLARAMSFTINKDDLREREDALYFIFNAYDYILKRNPDIKGLESKLEQCEKSKHNKIEAGLNILLQMSRSQEALSKKEMQENKWPDFI